jgi:hypothetical protein
MTSLSRIRRALSNPVILRRKLGIVAARPFTRPTTERTPFLDRDWDVLVLLDACRYDLFDEYNPFDAQVERIHSNASQTREFIERNFVGRDCRDTVCVTASPQFADFDLSFAHVEHVWQDNWDSELRTVHPDVMADVSTDIATEFPNKRVIIHFIQPHYPFIGETGRKIGKQASLNPGSDRLSVWEQMQAGLVDEHTIRDAYAENLRLALPAVQRLSETLTGKVVVSSDHGNLFGQRVCWLPIRIYGHPAGIHHPELTAVPWVELPYENRREVVSASDTDSRNKDMSEAENRLRELGYLS